MMIGITIIAKFRLVLREVNEVYVATDPVERLTDYVKERLEIR